jgi:hypothetical protein
MDLPFFPENMKRLLAQDAESATVRMIWIEIRRSASLGMI